MNEKLVVVVGGSNIDLKGYTHRRYIPRTSNPGTVKERIGGVARNIAETLGTLGVSTTLLTAVGDDHFGALILDSTNKNSLNLEHVISSEEYSTGQYLALHDDRGELIGAISNMEVTCKITPRYLKQHLDLLKQADVLVIDANPTKDAISYLLSIHRKVQREQLIIADPVSVAKSEKLTGYLDEIDIITPNIDEIKSLFGLTLNQKLDIERLQAKLKDRFDQKALDNCLVVTDGRKGSFIVNQEGVEFHPAIPVAEEKIIGTTGAGDSLTGGLIYGLINGEDVGGAIELGLKAAAASIQTQRTVAFDLHTVTRD